MDSSLLNPVHPLNSLNLVQKRVEQDFMDLRD